MIGLGMESCVTWSGIYFAFFSNPHFPQLQNHSFNLQNHKMSQNHTYFRPCAPTQVKTMSLSFQSFYLVQREMFLVLLRKREYHSKEKTGKSNARGRIKSLCKRKNFVLDN